MKTDTTQQNVPSGWKQVALGDLVSVTTGKRDANHGSPDGQYPFFTCAQKVSRIDNFAFDTEAVLIAGNGDFNVKYYKGKFDAYQRTYILSDFKNTTGIFVFQKAKQALNEIIKNNQGSSVKFIKMGDLTDYPLLLPPIKEQQKIAEILGKVDEDIAKTQEVIDATEKLKRGLMQQLFTRGIGHTKFKETKIGQIPEEWEIANLSQISKNFDNKRIPITKSKRTAGVYPYYGATGVVDYIADYLFDKPMLLISEDGANLKDRNYPIAFTATGKYWVNNHAHIHKFEDHFLQKYVQDYLNQINLEPFLTGMAQPKLNKDRLFIIPIPKPKTKIEIQKIAEILSAVDEKISVNKKLKEKLTLLKKGLMQDLLSGKVRTNI